MLTFLFPVEIVLIFAQKSSDTMDLDSTDFCLVRTTFPGPDLQATTVIMDCYHRSNHKLGRGEQTVLSSAYPLQTTTIDQITTQFQLSNVG